MDPLDARCRSDQASDCSSAVGSDSLATFNYGGKCEPREYDIYDQLCTLNYFTPGADYCCCAHERKALCCRFHFDHEYFRCDVEEDTINVPLSLASTLIISGVVCAIVAIVIIVIVVKCVKGRRALRRNASANPNKNEPSVRSNPEAEPLQPPPQSPDDGNNNGNVSNGHVRTEPTAPPMDPENALPSYHRAMSEPADLQPTPTPQHGLDHPMYRLDSEAPVVRNPLLSPISEAPPAYDQHHNDPRYHPELDGETPKAEWF